jgi:hypothetical protein
MRVAVVGVLIMGLQQRLERVPAAVVTAAVVSLDRERLLHLGKLILEVAAEAAQAQH